MDAKDKTTKEPLVSIVDDDASVRRSTRRLLRCCGLRAEVFSSAEDFLQSELAAETTCLLLDVRMPKMDGLEACRLIRKNLPQVEILIVTQHDSPQMMRDALSAGARGYVVKSNMVRDLLPALDAVRQRRFFPDGKPAPDTVVHDSPEAPG